MRRVLVLEAGAGFGGSVVCLTKLVRSMRAAGFEMSVGILHTDETSAAFLRQQGIEARYVHCYRRPDRLNRALNRLGRHSRSAKVALLGGLLAVERPLARRDVRAIDRLVSLTAPDVLALNNGWNDRLMSSAARVGLERRVVVHGRGLWPGTKGARLVHYPQLAAMSRAVADSYIQAGWPADRAAVVYDPFTVSLPPPPPADMAALTGGRTTVALVGSLERWKGHLVFVEAAAILRHRYPAVQFLIVGGQTLAEPAYVGVLASRIRDLGVGDRVRVTGWRSDVSAIMAAADVVVHASIEPEPFGNVVAEAMSLARPVIAADAGGPREMIRDGIDGLLSAPGSSEELAFKISRLLDHEDLRRDLGTSARERVRVLFSEAMFMQTMGAIYERVLGG